MLAADTLPVRRVVMYRNGVAYIAREGAFSGSTLSFGVSAPDVGDFLTSLTPVELNDGTVRSVSFDVPEGEAGEEDGPRDAAPRVQVRLHFDEAETHRVAVGYVVANPIWRPAYRLQLDDRGLFLQAWAIVQNMSGEDWRDIRLSLTTGAPIAFRSDLGTPVVPTRPTVTDRGEVIDVVPEGSALLSQERSEDRSATPEQAAKRADFAAVALGHDPAAREEVASPLARERAAMAKVAQLAAPVSSGAAGDGMGAELPVVTGEAFATAGTLREGVTRYDLDRPVTIPHGGSTMVAVLSKRVPGRQVHLFAPEPDSPASQRYPYAVVRLKNATGALLERGPVSVYGKGGFLGQGLLAPLPIDGTAFVPFALDRTLAVTTAQEQGEVDGRFLRVAEGQIVVERFRRRNTRYVLRNGAQTTAEVFVKHKRRSAMDLVDPPAGTEEQGGYAWMPVEVPAKAKVVLSVVEQTPVERVVDFMGDLGGQAVRQYLDGPDGEGAIKDELAQALKVRKALLEAQVRERRLRQQRTVLQEQTAETRENLAALGTSTRVSALRQRLTDRIAQLEEQLADQTTELLELDTEIEELRIHLVELLRGAELAGGAGSPSAAGNAS